MSSSFVNGETSKCVQKSSLHANSRIIGDESTEIPNISQEVSENESKIYFSEFLERSKPLGLIFPKRCPSFSDIYS